MRIVPRSRIGRLTLGAVVLLGLSAAYVKHAQTKDPWAALPAVGASLPMFEFPLLKGSALAGELGGRLSPAALAGRPALLVIWSSECPYSHQALGGLERLRSEFEPHGVRIVLIAHEGDHELMRSFADSAKVQIPFALAGGREHLLSDPGAWSRLTAHTGFPKFIVVDRDGQVVHRAVGVTWRDTAGLQRPFPELRSVLDSLVRNSESGNVPPAA